MQATPRRVAAPARAIIDSVLRAKERTVAQLIVRKIEPEVVAALRKRAAHSGRSTEAEHREILRSVLRPDRGRRSMKEMLAQMPEAGEDADFARKPQRPRRVRL
jgi:plasmid stability protein